MDRMKIMNIVFIIMSYLSLHVTVVIILTSKVISQYNYVTSSPFMNLVSRSTRNREL